MFKVRFTNLGYGLDQTFARLKDTMAAGRKAHFEFSVSDQFGIVAAWSPIGGTREYRAIGADGELREASPVECPRCRAVAFNRERGECRAAGGCRP